MLSIVKDLEWWLATRSIVESELEEDPFEHRKTIASVGGKVGRASRASEYDEDDDE
jgi:hypothetical protein